MSDFLARLGARHLAEPVVRPRATSRFELTPALIVDPLLEETRPAAAERIPVEATATKRASSTPDAFSSARSQLLLPTPRTAPPESPEPVLAEHRSRETAPTATRSPRREPEESVVPYVDKNPHSIDGTRRRDAAEVVPRTVPPVVREATTIPTRVAEQATSNTPVDHTDHSTAAPDTIRVHIGRIEVRAVMTPAERPRSRGSKSSDAPGPLSLDRYLSGKGRP